MKVRKMGRSEGTPRCKEQGERCRAEIAPGKAGQDAHGEDDVTSKAKPARKSFVYVGCADSRNISSHSVTFVWFLPRWLDRCPMAGRNRT